MVEIADGLPMDKVSDRIRLLRKKFNLSQEDLGVMIGKTRTTVIRWEQVGPGENTALVVLALTQLYSRLSIREERKGVQASSKVVGVSAVQAENVRPVSGGTILQEP
jgi:transcriptional regulator with XRE-family HTH domain